MKSFIKVFSCTLIVVFGCNINETNIKLTSSDSLSMNLDTIEWGEERNPINDYKLYLDSLNKYALNGKFPKFLFDSRLDLKYKWCTAHACYSMRERILSSIRDTSILIGIISNQNPLLDLTIDTFEAGLPDYIEQLPYKEYSIRDLAKKRFQEVGEEY
jgi:hypothetical protein